MKVYYEEYINDFIRKDYTKYFYSLGDLEEWIFKQMKRDYRHNSLAMYFPQGPEPGCRISIHPAPAEPYIWIHRIDNGVGTIFTDGEMTCGDKFASKGVQEWLAHCQERRDKPQFNFVEN